MIIFLYGQDKYRSWQKLNEIIEGYKKAHKKSLSLRVFDNSAAKQTSTSQEVEQTLFQQFKDELCTPSIFKEKKLVVLIDIFSSSQFKKKLLKEKKWLKELKDIHFVIIGAGSEKTRLIERKNSLNLNNIELQVI